MDWDALKPYGVERDMDDKEEEQEQYYLHFSRKDVKQAADVNQTFLMQCSLV
mgnify:CR=1 FL=1